jgi:hypothetical protein
LTEGPLAFKALWKLFWRINSRPDELEKIFVYTPVDPPPAPLIAKPPQVYPKPRRTTISSKRRHLPRSPPRLAPAGFTLTAIDLTLHPDYKRPKVYFMIMTTNQDYLAMRPFHHHIWDVILKQQSQSVVHRRNPAAYKPPKNLVFINGPDVGVTAYILLQQLMAGKPVAWQHGTLYVYVFNDEGVECFDSEELKDVNMKEGEMDAVYICQYKPLVLGRWRVVLGQHPRVWTKDMEELLEEAGGVQVEWDVGMKEWFQEPDDFYLDTEDGTVKRKMELKEFLKLHPDPWAD